MVVSNSTSLKLTSSLPPMCGQIYLSLQKVVPEFSSVSDPQIFLRPGPVPRGSVALTSKILHCISPKTMTYKPRCAIPEIKENLPYLFVSHCLPVHINSSAVKHACADKPKPVCTAHVHAHTHMHTLNDICYSR